MREIDTSVRDVTDWVKTKRDLPVKTCPVCQRPFVWRKKWERCWEEVRYCSEKCRRHRGSAT
jgi:hypothetical protein